MVAMRVRDTGLGIAPNLLPHVFDLFTQADRTLDRAEGGLGIGLTLVKRLVEMHGGTVEARSEGLGAAPSSSCGCRCSASSQRAASPRASLEAARAASRSRMSPRACGS